MLVDRLFYMEIHNTFVKLEGMKEVHPKGHEEMKVFLILSFYWKEVAVNEELRLFDLHITRTLHSSLQMNKSKNTQRIISLRLEESEWME